MLSGFGSPCVMADQVVLAVGCPAAFCLGVGNVFRTTRPAAHLQVEELVSGLIGGARSPKRVLQAFSVHVDELVAECAAVWAAYLGLLSAFSLALTARD